MEKVTTLIPVGHPNRKGTVTAPKAVVVHYTANDSPTATDTNNVKYVGRAYKFANGEFKESDGVTDFRYGSAQWFIDQDSATLCIPQKEIAWGCGDRPLPYDNGCKGQTAIARDVFGYCQNSLTINYEICNNNTVSGTSDWDASCANAIEIIAQDMVKFNIATNMIYRHYDITGKICPKPFVDSPAAWVAFKAKIVARINQIKGVSPTPTPAVIATGIVTATSLNVRTGPGANCETNGPALVKGAKVSIYKEQSGWYMIGTSKWVSATYVTKSVTPSPSPEPIVVTGIITATSLNIRTEPVVKDGNLNGSLKKGAKVSVYEKKKDASGNLWYRIDKAGKQWVSASYVKL
jgi:N-acetylmuramoyl-L-alanine amidase